jgi:hypothetical protein
VPIPVAAAVEVVAVVVVTDVGSAFEDDVGDGPAVVAAAVVLLLYFSSASVLTRSPLRLRLGRSRFFDDSVEDRCDRVEPSLGRSSWLLSPLSVLDGGRLPRLLPLRLLVPVLPNDDDEDWL